MLVSSLEHLSKVFRNLEFTSEILIFAPSCCVIALTLLEVYTNADKTNSSKDYRLKRKPYLMRYNVWKNIFNGYVV